MTLVLYSDCVIAVLDYTHWGSLDYVRFTNSLAGTNIAVVL